MREHGFSLMELLVAMTITVVVMGSVFSLVQMNQPVFQAQPEVTDLQQNVRVAMDYVSNDVLMAGYNGGAYSNDGAGTRSNEPMAVYYDSADPNHANNDVIAVTAQGATRLTDRLEVAMAATDIAPLQALGPDNGSQTGSNGQPFSTIYSSSILWSVPGDGTICSGTNPPPSPAANFPSGGVYFIFQGGMMETFQLTQDGSCEPTGIKLQHNPSAPSGLNLPGGFSGVFDPGAQPPPTITKLVFYRYYLQTTDPNHPVLVREDLANPAQGAVAIANDIFDMQVKYTCASTAVCNEADVPPNQNLNGAGDPANPNTIVKVKITLRGQPNSLTLRQDQRNGGPRYIRNFELTSDMTPRNMTLSR